MPQIIYESYRIIYPTFYEETCDPEFPATCCFHHIVVVMIPESNVACMRLMCAMCTLHTLKLEFVKYFQTCSVTIKFVAQIFHFIVYFIAVLYFYFFKKKQTCSITS